MPAFGVALSFLSLGSPWVLLGPPNVGQGFFVYDTSQRTAPPPRSPNHLPPPPLPKPFADPRLEAAFNQWMIAYSELMRTSGQDLVQARQSLNNLRENQAEVQNWVAAKTLVEKVGAHRQNRERLIRQLRSLTHGSNFRLTVLENGKLQETLSSVSESACASDQNYIDILERLLKSKERR